MLYTTVVFLCALLRFLAHPKEVFRGKPNSRRGCQDNREEFGFALVGHDFKSVHAENFARCFFECSLEERCQSVTFLWNEKECQMKNETKKSRPGDFVENPAATYMENNFRGLSIQPLFLDKGPGWRSTSNQMILYRIYGQSFNWLTPLYWYFKLPTTYIIARITAVRKDNWKES